MNATPEEIVKEALTVRDDGRQPRFTADEYEQAMLAVARSNQRPSENIAQALARVVEIDENEINALIFAADRARARADFGKSAPVEKVMKSSSIALDAELVRKGSTPRYTRDDYHNEMVALSKSLARPNETPAVAFSRLCGEGVFDNLYAAGERADIAEIEAATKAAPPDDRFYPLLLDMAQMRKRDGETLERCIDRLLTSDRTVMDAYAASQGL